jgi:hypothetical protein
VYEPKPADPLSECRRYHALCGHLAPAYYVVAAAVVSLLTILTIRETAGRSLARGVADEMFQSSADLRGAATPG